MRTTTAAAQPVQRSGKHTLECISQSSGAYQKGLPSASVELVSAVFARDIHGFPPRLPESLLFFRGHDCFLLVYQWLFRSLDLVFLQL